MVKRFAVLAALTCAIRAATAQAPEAAPPYPAPKSAPTVVRPGRTNSDPPSDAIVLFNGTDLSRWRSEDGSPAKWIVRDDYVEVRPGAGGIATTEKFGDVQLHIEWATPSVVKGEGQERGNSGVFLMDRYEVQVLDSYQNETYYHGQAGAVYKQYPPLVNASRKPGEWQAYDIIFHAPRFDEMGKAVDRARMTVFHNGVLIQNNVELYGITYNDRAPVYIPHGPQESLALQDHGVPVRYRNIWIRRL